MSYSFIACQIEVEPLQPSHKDFEHAYVVLRTWNPGPLWMMQCLVEYQLENPYGQAASFWVEQSHYALIELFAEASHSPWYTSQLSIVSCWAIASSSVYIWEQRPCDMMLVTNQFYQQTIEILPVSFKEALPFFILSFWFLCWFALVIGFFMLLDFCLVLIIHVV